MMILRVLISVLAFALVFWGLFEFFKTNFLKKLSTVLFCLSFIVLGGMIVGFLAAVF